MESIYKIFNDGNYFTHHYWRKEMESLSSIYFKGTIEKINQIQSKNRKVSSNCIIEAFSESFNDIDGKRLQNIFPFSLDSDQIIKSYK